MEGHVALVVLPHSARWDEGRGQPQSQVSSQFFSLSAGAPLPLFSLLQDVCLARNLALACRQVA